MAYEIGLRESVLFLTMDEWIIGTYGDFEVEEKYGQRWIRLSVTSIKKVLPFWSTQTIRNTLYSLYRRRLIIAVTCGDQEKNCWISINHREVERLKCIDMTKGGPFENTGELKELEDW